MAMAIDKVFPTRESAVTDIFDGATIMIGSWGMWAGTPVGLIKAVRHRGTKNLTLIANNCGCMIEYPDGAWADHGQLFEAEQVQKVICCWTRSASFWFREKMFHKDLLGPAVRQIKAGFVEVELSPQGTLQERIRAGGAGLGGFYTKVGVGTIIENGKEKKYINGQEYMLELPLTADFALIRGFKADRMGNVVCRTTGRALSYPMATAAEVTIAEVEEIVETGNLDPETIHIPSIYVNRIVEIPKEEVRLWRRKKLD